MTTPKAIIVVGPNGVEKAHVLYQKGEVDRAVSFYEQLVPAISEIDERAKQSRPEGQADQP